MHDEGQEQPASGVSVPILLKAEAHPKLTFADVVAISVMYTDSFIVFYEI